MACSASRNVGYTKQAMPSPPPALILFCLGLMRVGTDVPGNAAEATSV